MRQSLTLNFLILVQGFLFAQNPVFRSISDETGLPSNEVYSIIQDGEGMIWIGCDAGLYKYNGTKFISYSNAAKKSRAVTGLCISSSGKIYCYNFSGQLFYVSGDSLKELKNTAKSINNIASDNAENLLINHDNGFSVYNEKLETWRHYDDFDNDGVTDSIVFTNAVRTDANGNAWFMNQSKLKRIQNGNFFSYHIFNEKDSYKEDNMILECRKDEVWLVAKSGNALYRKSGEKIEVVSKQKINELLYNRQVTGIWSLEDDCLWFTTYNGLVRYQPESGDAQLFYPEFSFSKVLIDREGQYWFSTLQNGILIAPDLDNRLWLLSKENDASNKLKHLTAYNENIYCATGLGTLGKLNFPTGDMRTYAPGIKADIQSLYYDEREQKVFFSIINQIYFLKNDRVQTADFSLPTIKCLRRVKNQFIGASSFGTYIYHNGKTEKINDYWSRDLIVDSLNNTFWVATNEGLLHYVFENEKWMLRHTLFQGTQIISLSKHEKNEMLYALASSRNVFSIDKNRTSKLVVALPENVQAYQLVLYEDQLLFATNKGLWLYDLNEKKWHKKDRHTGLSSDNVQRLLIRGNHFWLATGKGLQAIPLDFYKRKIPTSNIFLRKIAIDNTTQPIQNSYTANYRNNLALWLETNTFIASENVEFAYRINNYDTTWIRLPANMEYIDIPNLPSGNLRIELKAIDYFGRDSANILSFEIHVAPPFWQRWWFYLLIAVGAVAATYSGFRYRINLLRKKQTQQIEKLQLENELRLMQQSALKAQMNPHFIFNVLNSIKGFI